MKDLTHYFNSPKDEDVSKSQCTSQNSNTNEPVENKELPTKKRKLSLSKSKAKREKNKPALKESSSDVYETKSGNNLKTDVIKDDNAAPVDNKKRKRQQDHNTSCKKIKVSKSIKLSNKKSDLKSSCNDVEDHGQIKDTSNKEKNSLVNVEDRSLIVNKHDTCNSIPVGELVVHTKGKKRLKKNSLTKSDIEITSKVKEKVHGKDSSESTVEQPLDSEKSPDSSRKSLFSYFNSTNGSTSKVAKSSKLSNRKCDINLDGKSVENKDKIKGTLKKVKGNLSNAKDKYPLDEEIENDDSKPCDEQILQSKKKKCLKTKLFSESDNETSIKQKESACLSISGLEQSVNEKSPDSSRNSLFSYFNKVDKETALKQKPEKIKVEVLVHLPPNDGKKPNRRSLDKLPFTSKSKMRKNKIKLENSDVIEVVCSEEIVDENIPVNINAQMSPKLETQVNTVVKENDPSKIIQSNLASIFVSKKDKQNVPLKNAEIEVPDIKSLPNNEKRIVGSVEKHSQKKTKLQNQKISNNLDKSNKNCPSSKENVKDVLSNDPKLSKPLKINIPKNKSEEINTKKLKNHKMSSDLHGFVKSASQTLVETKSSSKEVSSEVKEEINLISPKSSNKKSQDSSLRTPTKNVSDNSTNDLKTPKKKSSTLNGYFTPKSRNSNCKEKSSEEKSYKNPNSSSPWVMKVRISRASNPLSDSEEDSKDSIQVIEQKKLNSQIKSETHENDEVIENDNSSIVVIDDGDGDEDDGDSLKNSQKNNKRKTLPRSAKRLKLTSSDEEKKVESPKPPVKLWPFFQKGKARPLKEAPVDEAKLRAKMLFLESGVPEVIKRKVENVRNEALVGQPAPFPTVSHVTQNNAWDGINVPMCRLPPPCSVSTSLQPPSPSASWDTLISRIDPEEPEIPVFQRPGTGDVKAFLEQLKEEEPKTEVKALFKKLKEYKSKADSTVWTDVYKPTKAADMVGNSESIKKLKTWLETLKNRRRREGSESSGDEFVNDDSDGEGSTVNNMAVLTGPCGCGKTSAVYALANELDCKVLEINSSCNRSGKRILAEFSESTQSHQVERAQPLNGLFNNQKTVKMKKKKKSKLSTEAKTEKTSLILVEDADLLFPEMDEGFVPALASLAANSKRPLILVTNSQQAPHLERFNNTQLLQLTFSRPKPAKLGLWLRLVGLVEGVMMTAEQASQLVEWSDCDVRRCLLQLQLMVHSNNSEVRESLTESQLWWRWPAQYQLQYELPTLLEPEETVSPPIADKKELIKQLQSVSSTTSRLAVLDVLSSRSRLRPCNTGDVCPVAWRGRCVDSTSVTPPCDLAVDATTCQLVDWLAHVAARDLPSDSTRTGRTVQEARWLSVLRQGEQMFMSGVAMTAQQP
ncbi:replication factor C subunit 1 isoform X2 [Homalodisca vitripennis]|uniref:replication factor C subunit 1 isoform X2 n=1 Tax=Homalodisca vitripennis TaxID=197043 RepID=UPI001EEAEC7D|nr:replication factor C subunit 1 isoform X2 [Homalodisca vitripennis]